jgi:hypothetical protein
MDEINTPPVGGWDQMDWRVFERNIDIQKFMDGLRNRLYTTWDPFECDAAHHFRTVHANNLRWNCYKDLPD